MSTRTTVRNDRFFLLFFRLLVVCHFIPTIVACAHNKDHTKQYSAPSEIQPYVNSFLEASKQAGHPTVIDDLIIELVPSLGAGLDGLCTIDGGTPRIRILSSNWNAEGDPDYVATFKELLIWHELGHCVLLRNHRGDLAESADRYGIHAPKSIMHDRVTVAEVSEFRLRRGEYILELFGAGDGPN